MKLKIIVHRNAARDLAAVAALTVGVAVGTFAAGVADAGHGSLPAETRRATRLEPSPAPTADREAILTVIRQHRRRADESWARHLADTIYEESVEASIDPLLVASIVAKESSFRSRAVSRKGAVGLMQLRPWVARDLASRHDLEWNGLDTLHDPTANVRLGISYYKELVQRFDGDEFKALTAYNRGPTRVSLQLRDGTYGPSRYAREILELYGRLSAGRANRG